MGSKPAPPPRVPRAANALGREGSFSDSARLHLATELVVLCRAAGVRFLARHTVAALRRTRGRVSHVDAVDAQGEPVALEADAFVLALAPASMRHARDAGIELPPALRARIPPGHPDAPRGAAAAARAAARRQRLDDRPRRPVGPASRPFPGLASIAHIATGLGPETAFAFTGL